MTEKLFHVSNDEAIISNVSFDEQFQGKKENWINQRKGDKRVSDRSKSGCEAIQRSLVVSVSGKNGSIHASGGEFGQIND